MARTLDMDTKPAKPKKASHQHKAEVEHDGTTVTNVDEVFCTTCGMEKNDDFIEPTHMCGRCFYPIPKAQGIEGKCPRCKFDIFVNYIKEITPAIARKIHEQVEEEVAKVEQ